MPTKEELPPCPVATCFQLFGNKWKIYISQKVLSSNLKEMEAAGLVTRTVIPETPIRTEYALSEVGESLMPVINSMVEWGSGYQRLVREDG